MEMEIGNAYIILTNSKTSSKILHKYLKLRCINLP